ncbi:hypothetical protein AB1Y20_018283 [Prymnesium parvum]|uniref:Acyl-CoA oxidase/dehydrogenase middle domain-containing protein n=1 Tax=Prymnesium parvum TaxID=97485 RepID=A0AB34JNF1_PRYPA
MMAARPFRRLAPHAARLPRPHPPRALSIALAHVDDHTAWESAFVRATDHVSSSVSHSESAAAMRALLQTGVLRHTDLRDHPERFFKAHRLLARHAVQHGPGFWIRFTVHYNLCMGTVLAVGSDEQIAGLDAIQERGELGCFALTEKLAGVQSGLLVQTTCDFDAETDEFVLNTPAVGAQKNWISQGFTADKAVVLADLTVGGERRGPHAFLINLREEGELVRGVSVGDMGVKTTGNDLDNAWISFDRVRIPRSSLLNRYAQVSAEGEYAITSKTITPFEMIGQRLYTGRVAVAQAALSYCAKLFEVTQQYTDAKPIWSPGREGAVLSGIPQLRALYQEAAERMEEMDAFVGKCEAQLSPLLRSGEVPTAELTHAIAVAKVKAVETSIDLCWRLKQEVGSYALMGESGFVHLDFLNCCKFAEGDSRILMQKMARDRYRRAMKEQKAGAAPPPAEEEEARLCAQLAEKLGEAKGDKRLEASLWDEQWQTVYALAEATMARTLKQFGAPP